MANRFTKSLLMAVAIGVPAWLGAQVPADTPQVKALVDSALRTAGPEWKEAATFFCSTEDQVNAMKILPSATVDDLEGQRAEPMKVFDNLYFVGQKAVTTWAITTPDGIILIDAGYAARVDDTLVAGMRKVGLDPANIKLALIAHGHDDHFGGARALHERFGTRIGMSAQDWDFIQPKPGQANEGSIPARDLVLEEGRAVMLGGTSVIPVLIPGHTPGSMGFIFPVKDGAKTYTAGLFGGTVLNPARRLPIAGFQEYLRSLEHWRDVTGRAGADVALMNHPIMDGLFVKLAQLKSRKRGDPHPLVIGSASFQRLATVQADCMKAQIARR